MYIYIYICDLVVCIYIYVLYLMIILDTHIISVSWYNVWWYCQSYDDNIISKVVWYQNDGYQQVILVWQTIVDNYC